MSATTAEAPTTTATDQHEERDYRESRDYRDYRESGRLSRSADDRMLAGVAGGLARYLNVDATLVRIGVAALILLTGVGAALYIAAWLLIPADGEDQSIAAAWIAGRQDDSR
jgi:phage shock protein PspC (stress-responsive transcriptional regulator)